MKKGSLDVILKEAQERRRAFHWPARYKIAVDIVTSCKHLQVQHNPSIIHRYLKPTNIILKGDMETLIHRNLRPKISEFKHVKLKGNER